MRCVAIARFLLHGSLIFSAHSFELFRVRCFTGTVVFLIHLTPIGDWTLCCSYSLTAFGRLIVRNLIIILPTCRHVPCIPIAFQCRFCAFFSSRQALVLCFYYFFMCFFKNVRRPTRICIPMWNISCDLKQDFFLRNQHEAIDGDGKKAE